MNLQSLSTKSPIAELSGIEIAKFLLAIETENSRQPALSHGRESTDERRRAQARVRRILAHLKLLTSLGFPALAPLVQIFLAHLDESKTNKKKLYGPSREMATRSCRTMKV